MEYLGISGLESNTRQEGGGQSASDFPPLGDPPAPPDKAKMQQQLQPVQQIKIKLPPPKFVQPSPQVLMGNYSGKKVEKMTKMSISYNGTV